MENKMWTAVLALITELIANKKRGFWLTILLIVILSHVGFFQGHTKGEIQAAASPIIARMDSIENKSKQSDFMLLFYLKKIESMEKSQERTEHKIDKLDDKIDKLKRR